MTAQTATETGDVFDAGERAAAVSAQSDRNLWISLAVALLLHASFLISFARDAPRSVGADKGDVEAVAVSLLTEEEFRAQTSAPAVPQAVPGPPAERVAPVTQPTPPPAPPSEQKPEAKPEPKAEPPPLKETIAEQPAEKPEPAKTEAAPFDEKAKDLFSLEPPKKAEPKPEKAEPRPQQKKPEQKVAKLDQALPPSQSFAAPPVDGGGRAGAFARPPGITKSGWNDAFARGVIRALQMTMPQMRAMGRVTVRIFLDQNGNVSEVNVIKPSPDSNLNQSVVFAARQTSYPFPPVGATVADRTFLVTYIYN